MSDRPLNLQDTIAFRCGTQECPGRITAIENKFDPSTLSVIEKHSSQLHQHESAIVHVQVDESLVLEAFEEVPELGRFTIERDNQLAGAGTIITTHE